MKTRILFAAAAAALIAGTGTAFAATRLAAGSTLAGTIDTSIDSRSASPGQGFHVVNAATSSGSLTGATIYGHVASVTKASQGRRGQIKLAFDRVRTADGTYYPVNAEVASVEQKSQNTIARDVAGAVVGDVVGNIIGKKVGTNLGGLAGAAGGYIFAHNMGTNVSIPSGSTVRVQLDSPLTVYPRHPQQR